MNTVTTGSDLPTTTARPGRRRSRLWAVLAATTATLAGWVIAVPLAGVDLVADSGGTVQRVTPVAVAVATLLAGLAAWGLLALLERLTTRARPVWTVVALVVLLLSLLGPVGGGVGTAATATLVAMHLAAAAVLVPLLYRSAGR